MKKKIKSNTYSESNANKYNPKIGREFEGFVKTSLDIKFGIKFSKQAIRIGNPPKAHSFDLVSENGNIIVECKNYSWTTSGNVPSAKCATLNEAVLYLIKSPKNAKKIIVLRRSFNDKKKESLAEYYSRTYAHLLDGISIMELDTDNMVLKSIKGVI